MIRRLAGYLPLAALAGLVIFAVSVLVTTKPTQAQTQPDRICRAAMIIDRSGSVGGPNMQTIRTQIRRLFEPISGIYDAKVELAFWSFSHEIRPIFGSFGDYNTPSHSYISSVGPMSASFNSALNALFPAGNTNYQQAFAYDGATRNPALNDVIERTNILVFMTDGQPNSVNGGMFGTAAEAGRVAAQNHQDAGRFVLGGSIGANAAQVRVINYVVSNDENNYNNTFTVSTNYDDLARKLKQEITDKCDELFPPDPCPYNPALQRDDPNCVPPPVPAYNLIPLVTSDNPGGVISSDESTRFDYRVTNESINVTSGDTGWSIKQVVVDKDQDACRIGFRPNCTSPLPPADPYRDEYSCAALLSLVGGGPRSTCQEVATGTRQFAPGQTFLSDAEVGSARQLAVEDKWPVGTKVCYVLSLNKPSEKATPTNRHSPGVCVVIGKRPSVQVWGGDLSVGSVIPGDPEGPNALAAKIQTGLTVKAPPVDGVYGSWVEYGVFAPGTVTGVGSASGLKNGFHPATSGAAQAAWSKLTFANTGGQYGSFSDARVMPNVAGGLLGASQAPTEITTPTVSFDGGGIASGVYEKPAGDLVITGSVIERGRSLIVHVPNGTVTVDGNISYTNDPLGSLDEIPRLVIIARNIDIKAGVTNVDAWLIARNSPSGSGGGVINTCSDGPAALTINDCNQQLRINGPVIARDLLLRRTAGAGNGSDENSDQPGEIINLRADAYLSALARRTDIAVPTTTYSVELPPRF